MLHDDYPPPSLIDRVFAAIITPIVFHFSMLITVAFWLSFLPQPASNRSALVISQILINYLSRIPSEIFLVIGLLLPAGAGFVLGLNKLGDYLLIFFPFGNSDERPDYYKTMLAWALIAGLGLVYAKLLMQ